MEEYKSNSNASKLMQEEKKKIEPVVTNPVKQKKKTGIKRFLDLFVAEEKENIKTYIILDVLVPTIKKAIYDTFAGGLSMYLFGEESNRTSKSTASKISYRKFFDDPVSSRQTNNSKLGTVYDFDDFIFETKGEAEDVLRSMDELIDVYGVVSIGDFYELVNVQCEHPTQKYGWTNIRNATIMRVRDGWMIKFPKAFPLT